MGEYESKTTSDGWSYGKGKFEKSIADYLGVKAPSFSTMVSVPSVLVSTLAPGAVAVAQAVQVAGTAVAQIAYGKIASITIPTYYVWTKSPSGVKTVAEWPLAEMTRDIEYSGWEPNFVGSPSSAKQSQINLLRDYKAAPVSLGSLMTAMKTEVDLYFDVKKMEIRNIAEKGATSAVIPLLVATVAAVAVIVLLGRKS